MSHGMEHWHPNPSFFFKPGGGPILDMGPYYLAALCNLLGPIESVQAMTSIGFAERVVTAEGPNKGSRIAVETPTTVMALIRFVSRRRHRVFHELGCVEARPSADRTLWH